MESHRRLGGIERLVIEAEGNEVAAVELQQVGAPGGPGVDHLVDHDPAVERQPHAALGRNAEPVKACLGDGDVARPCAAEVAGLAVGGEGDARLVDAIEVHADRLGVDALDFEVVDARGLVRRRPHVERQPTVADGDDPRLQGEPVGRQGPRGEVGNALDVEGVCAGEFRVTNRGRDLVHAVGQRDFPRRTRLEMHEGIELLVGIPVAVAALVRVVFRPAIGPAIAPVAEDVAAVGHVAAGRRRIPALEVHLEKRGVAFKPCQAREGMGVLAGGDRNVAGEQLSVALLEIEKHERVPLRRGRQRDGELGRVGAGFRDPALRRCRDHGKGRRAALAGGLVVFDGQRVVVEDEHREARGQLGVGPVAARDLKRELPSDVAIHAAVIDALQEQFLHLVPVGGREHQVESRSAGLAWSAHPHIAVRAEAQADIARRAAREPDAETGLGVGGLVGFADPELAGARPAAARGVEVAPGCQELDVGRVVVGQFGRAGSRWAADAVAAAAYQAQGERLGPFRREVIEHVERQADARCPHSQSETVEGRGGEAGGVPCCTVRKHGRRRRGDAIGQ